MRPQIHCLSVWPTRIGSSSRRSHIRKAALALLLPVWAYFAASQASAADLTPLMIAPTVMLNGSTTYQISEYVVSANKTLLCNGATIQVSSGPIRASAAGVTLTVDNCVFQGVSTAPPWALLGALNGASLVVHNNTRLTANGSNSAVYVQSATADMVGGSIDQSMYGFNMQNATAGVHGVVFTNTTYAVQNVAGTVTIDGNSQLTNLNPNSQGTGVSLLGSPTYPSRGAVAIIRDSVFTGFQNAVDIQPTAASGLPSGTADITGTTFNIPFVAAFSANDATNVHFANNLVTGAKGDGIFLLNTTGVIEDSQILGSLNSGVTFWGCAGGATIRNSLVSGSTDQGIAVVADPVNHRISHNVQVIDNTLKNNVLANILVDDLSDALVQGNTLIGAPDFSARLHGSPAVSLIADLFFKSGSGLEMKDGANAISALSIYSNHGSKGSLTYANAKVAFAHSAFQSNGLTTSGGDYSLFANSTGQVTVQRSTFEPALQPALYNMAGNTGTASNNFWSAGGGPKVNGSGAGALLDWANGSNVTYQPFLGTSPLIAITNNAFNLNAGAPTIWNPNIDLQLSLTGAAGITHVSNALVAELRLADTSTFVTRVPPAGTFADGVVAVWIEYDLLSRSAAGSNLRFRTTGSGATAVVYRLEPDRSWLQVPATWDAAAGQIVYSPADVTTLNGVFALGAPQPDRETVARQLITSFYLNILGRPPEAGAVDSWYFGYFLYAVSAGVDVRFVPREMARVFFGSGEYQARGRTSDQFIRDCYQVFLRRVPSQFEIDGWLAGTWIQPQVVTQFSESPEFDQYIQGLFPGLSGSQSSNLVTTMYIGLLDRLVDAGGLAGWKGQFDTSYLTGGIEGVRTEAKYLGSLLLASAEYQSKNPTNDTNVIRLYRGYLGRYPGSDEIAYWRGQLDARAITTTGLIDLLAGSAESTARLSSLFGPS